jgi:hypothetical protein
MSQPYRPNDPPPDMRWEWFCLFSSLGLLLLTALAGWVVQALQG